MSGTVVSVGAVCFGVVVGYVVYRSLARSGPTSSVSDIAAVVGTVGGGVVTALFDPADSDSFGWYSIGLVVGMAAYVVVSLTVAPKAAEKNKADESAKPGSVFLGSDPAPEHSAGGR